MAKKPKYADDVGLSDTVLSAISYVTAQWGQLEDVAGMVTAHLLSTDHFDFRGIAVHMPGRSKLEGLCAIAERKLSLARFRKIRKITEAAKGLQAERNRIVHGCWYPTDREHVAVRYTYTAYGSLRPKGETVSAARLRGYGVEVGRLTIHLIAFLETEGFYKRTRIQPSWPLARKPSPRKRRAPAQSGAPAGTGQSSRRPTV
jgi:hypothetical protein